MDTKTEAGAAEAKLEETITRESLVDFVKTGKGEVLEDLHKQKKLFEKTHTRLKKLDGLAVFDEFEGTLSSGTYGDKVAEVKQIAEEMAELKDLQKITSESGLKTKETQRQIDSLQRKVSLKARGALSGVEKLVAENQKVQSEASKEYFGLVREVTKAENEAIAAVKETLTREGLAPKDFEEKFQEQKSLIKERTIEVKEALKDAHQERISKSTEMADAIKSVTKDIEEVTGKSASEILGKAAKGSHVEKLSKEGSEVAKEGNALIRFAKGNPIKTAIGAAVVGALGMAMLRGGNRQEGAAR